MKSSNTRSAWLLAGLIGGVGLPDAAEGDPADLGANANTVIGADVLLSEGAAALMNGDWQRGIELTESGIGGTISREDHAAALANLCAGYAALKQFQKALGFCDQSLTVLATNWRTWQNRAACHLGMGKIEESLQDIQRGLQLNPDSDALQKTLAIARDYEKLQQERMQHLLES
jgi:tetratricopeptide (TPR) repeat protein